MASDQENITSSDLIDLSTFLEETSKNKIALSVEPVAALSVQPVSALTVEPVSAPTVEPVSELQQALRIVKNADLPTTRRIHEACIDRVEELRNQDDQISIAHLYSDLIEALDQDPEQASLQAQNQTTTSDAISQMSKSISAGAIDQIPKEIDMAMYGRHQMSKGRDGTPTGQSGLPNDFPTHMPYAKLYDSGDHSYKFHESNPFHPLRSHPPEDRVPSVPVPTFKPGQEEIPQPHDQSAEDSKGHMRKAPQMSPNRSESMVADAGNKLRGGLTSMRDMVMAKAASVASLSTMRNRMPGAFDEEDEFLFGPPDRPTKRLEVVRVESPLGTRAWVVKEKKDRRCSSFIEDGQRTAARNSIADNGQRTAARHSIADDGRIAARLSQAPVKQTLSTNELPATPLPKASRPSRRSAFPPRISSLSSPASKISEKDSDNNDTEISGVHFGSFPDNIDLDYTFGSEESGLSDMGGEGGIGNVDGAVEGGFEPIGSSQLMRGFKRLSSAKALSSAQGLPASTSENSLPRLVPSKSAATGQKKPYGLTRRTTTRARALTTNLFRKASASIRRTKKIEGPGQQMVKRGDDGSEKSKRRGGMIPID